MSGDYPHLRDALRTGGRAASPADAAGLATIEAFDAEMNMRNACVTVRFV
jgi:hypothetical protein